MKEKGYSQRLLPLLSLFVLLQPIIDVFTSFGTRSGHAITVGIVIRTAVMACFFVYVVFFSRGPQRKLCVIYTLLITCYIGVFLGGALLKGGFYAAFGNFKEVIKTFYFNYILVGLFSLYKQYGFTVSDRVLAGTNLLYTGIIFLAFATGSSYYTYPVNKLGYNGWFYAGNEIGVIISILSCFSF